MGILSEDSLLIGEGNHFNIHVCITCEDIGTKYRNVKIYSPESTQLKYYKMDGSSMDIYLNGLKTMATIVLESENERIV